MSSGRPVEAQGAHPYNPFNSFLVPNTHAAPHNRTPPPIPIAAGALSADATLPDSSDQSGAITTHTNAYADITRPRRLSGVSVCSSPFASALFRIIVIPVKNRMRVESQMLRENANAISRPLKANAAPASTRPRRTRL